MRRLTDPHHSAFVRGDGIVVKFTVLASKFGPVEVELDTGEALALIDEIDAAINEADELASGVPDGPQP